jgi:hypothetical protein
VNLRAVAPVDEMLARARARALTSSIVTPSKPPFHKQKTLYSCVPTCLRMVFAAFSRRRAAVSICGRSRSSVDVRMSKFLTYSVR